MHTQNIDTVFLYNQANCYDILYCRINRRLVSNLNYLNIAIGTEIG